MNAQCLTRNNYISFTTNDQSQTALLHPASCITLNFRVFGFKMQVSVLVFGLHVQDKACHSHIKSRYRRN